MFFFLLQLVIIRKSKSHKSILLVLIGNIAHYTIPWNFDALRCTLYGHYAYVMWYNGEWQSK